MRLSQLERNGRFGGDRFVDVTPSVILKHDAPHTHSVLWTDFYGDGDLDLSLADNGAYGQ
jgi:hypothetical protein